MPTATIIDLSQLSAEQLRGEIEAMRNEREDLLRFLSQIDQDIARAEAELKNR